MFMTLCQYSRSISKTDAFWVTPELKYIPFAFISHLMFLSYFISHPTSHTYTTSIKLTLLAYPVRLINTKRIAFSTNKNDSRSIKM